MILKLLTSASHPRLGPLDPAPLGPTWGVVGGGLFYYEQVLGTSVVSACICNCALDLCKIMWFCNEPECFAYHFLGKLA